MKRLMIALALVLSAPQASAQDFYAFHDQFKSIYFTTELPGWGFAADIQKGILFVAIFGYDQTGKEAFLTLQSEKVGTDNPFSFSGTVFQTDQNGTRTRDVGSFTWNTISVDGQPGALLNMDSPFLDVTNLILNRFGYVEDDPLDVMEGKSIGLLLTQELPGSSQFAANLGNFLDFREPRSAFSDGLPFLPGTSPDGTVSAGFYYNPDEERYEMLVVEGDETVAYLFLLVSHNTMQGDAILILGNQQSQPVIVLGTYVAELTEPPTAKGAGADLAALEKAYRQLRELD